MPTSPSHDLYKEILNALPTPVFLVDADMFVLEYNQAAHDLLIAPARSTPGQRGGHVLSCLNAVNRPEGCGRTQHCGKCGLRGALNDARAGARRVQTRATLRLVRDGQPQDRLFIITISPFSGTEGRWLLVMDDRTEQAELEKIFPLCSSCREVRTDNVHRQNAETYLTRHWDGDPAACLCPGCRQRLLGAEG